MAIDCADGNTTRYYTVTGDASMQLPDGDWAIPVWLLADDNSGTNFQYYISWGTVATNNSINTYLVEASQSVSGNRDRMVLNIKDASGDVYTNGSSILLATNNYGGDSNKRLFVFMRTGTTGTIYSCLPGQTPVLEATDTNASFGSVSPTGDLYIGARNDLNTDRFWEEHLGEFGIFHDSFTVNEIEALAAGFPALEMGKDCRCYLPFYEANSTVYDLSGNGNHATKNGSPVTSPHFPVNEPWDVISIVTQDSGAAPSFNPFWGVRATQVTGYLQ